MMRWSLAPQSAALLAGVLAAACAAGEPNPYPASAQARFNATCPGQDTLCACTWDKLTRSMTYQEYEAAMERYRAEGLMDPKVTRARTACLG